MVDGPLLIFGPRSLTYDFGPHHPLSPRRFGPGIELLRTLGGEPGLAPEPAADDELEWLHASDYIAATSRRISLGSGSNGSRSAAVWSAISARPRRSCSATRARIRAVARP